MTSALEILGLAAYQTKSDEVPSSTQEQTNQAFSYKWARRETYESPAMQDRARDWLIERYCESDPKRVAAWLGGGEKVIVDAGCGSGFSAMLLFGDLLNDNYYLGVDSTDAVEVGKQRFTESGYKGDFIRHDITTLPLPDASVDLILAEGVLHHTDDTGAALQHLSKALKEDGRFLFYVYRKKGPVREFTDDLIRDSIRDLSDDEAWEALLPLSELGKSLGELDAHLHVPSDIPLLGIKAGDHDLQRFFYWHVVKAFYGPDLTLEEMNHINFDWFRPLNCHRHTPQEVASFCEDADLSIDHINLQEAGITVVASKKGD